MLFRNAINQVIQTALGTCRCVQPTQVVPTGRGWMAAVVFTYSHQIRLSNCMSFKMIQIHFYNFCDLKFTSKLLESTASPIACIPLSTYWRRNHQNLVLSCLFHFQCRHDLNFEFLYWCMLQFLSIQNITLAYKILYLPDRSLSLRRSGPSKVQRQHGQHHPSSVSGRVVARWRRNTR